MTERVIIQNQKHTLVKGEKKQYSYPLKYTINSHVFPDGSIFKLSPEQVEEIKKLRATGVTIQRLMEDYDCSRETIRKALLK